MFKTALKNNPATIITSSTLSYLRYQLQHKTSKWYNISLVAFNRYHAWLITFPEGYQRIVTYVFAMI